MRASQILFLYFFFLVFITTAFAQDLKFKHLTPEDGLSVNGVNSIIQDHHGFMWIGTDNGLNRYDGKSFIIYKNIPGDSLSISDSWIHCLAKDNDGLLWIGTDGGGLNFYDAISNSFRAYKNYENCSNCITNNLVRSIAVDKDGLLWIGTDLGLNTFDYKSGKFENFITIPEDSNSIPNHQINKVFIDYTGTIWIGTYKSGLISFNKKSKKFQKYSIEKSDDPNLQRNLNKIKDIYEDAKKNLWIGTEGGLCLLDKSTNSIVKINAKNESYSFLTSPRVYSITEGQAGQLWIATNGNGLISYNTETKKFKNYLNITSDLNSLSSNNLRCVYKDRAESFWIGSVGSGLNVYHKTLNQFGLVKSDVGNPQSLQYPPMCFYDDPEGFLWIGTYGGGISKYNKEAGTIEHFDYSKNKINEKILAFYEDASSRIWIGSWGNGFNYYDKNTHKFSQPVTSENSELINNTVTVIHPNNKNELWIGTLKGLNLYDISKNKIIAKYTDQEGLSANGVYALHLDSKKVLWIGTNGGGLNSIDLKSKKITHYKKIDDDDSSISHDKVYCIYEGKEDEFWIGTRSGLNKFNKLDGKFKRYYESDGLCSDNIFGILGDNSGNLWISTIKGLSRFNASDISSGASKFRNYYSMDGLQNNEFNQFGYHKSKEGKMYFGGVNGYNAFFPDNIKDNKIIPPVVITSFKKFLKEVELDSSISNKKYIELSYKDNFIEFEFEVLDYILPFKNLYSYKMEGFDEDWTIPSTRNYASYTNLNGGDYVLKVRGSNSDGLWNENGVALHIKINPPIYKTGWFISLCIISVLMGIFFYIRYRTSKIEEEKKNLEEKVQERTIELAEKNKDITSSIQYAQRIQDAILPEKELVLEKFKDSFIFYLPKDIVSGDFYWFTEIKGKRIIAIVDCTGHGVPGAFMSMIGHNLFNQIVIERGITNSDEILTELNKGVQKSLKQDGHHSETSDGMDVALCVFEDATNIVEFSGAYRPLYILNKENFKIIEPNKFPIGGNQFVTERIYTKKVIQLKDGDTLYLFTDGYADQFGGPNSKKFMIKKFQETLKNNFHLNMSEQAIILEKNLKEWRGTENQVDDILVMGIRI